MHVSIDRDTLAWAANCARLCKHLYVSEQGPPPAGWQLLATSADIHPSMHGLNGAIYRRDCNSADGKPAYAVVLGGFNERDDLKSIFNIFRRRLPPQFDDALAFVDKACAQFDINHSEVELVGHSLGGYLARSLSRVREFNRSWCFSAPGPDRKTQEMLAQHCPDALPKTQDIIHIRSRYDAIALFGPDEKMTIELNTPRHHHDIAFLGYALDTQAGNGGQSSDHLHQPAPGRGNQLLNPIMRLISQNDVLMGLIRKLSDYVPCAQSLRHSIDVPKNISFPPRPDA